MYLRLISEWFYTTELSYYQVCSLGSGPVSFATKSVTFYHGPKGIATISKVHSEYVSNNHIAEW